MHPHKFGLWYHGVNGPYFFLNANGDAVSVNGELYKEIFLALVEGICDNNGDVDMIEFWV